MGSLEVELPDNGSILAIRPERYIVNKLYHNMHVLAEYGLGFLHEILLYRWPMSLIWDITQYELSATWLYHLTTDDMIFTREYAMRCKSDQRPVGCNCKIVIATQYISNRRHMTPTRTRFLLPPKLNHIADSIPDQWHQPASEASNYHLRDLTRRSMLTFGIEKLKDPRVKM